MEKGRWEQIERKRQREEAEVNRQRGRDIGEIHRRRDRGKETKGTDIGKEAQGNMQEMSEKKEGERKGCWGVWYWGVLRVVCV
jgi:hypothetical protein